MAINFKVNFLKEENMELIVLISGKMDQHSEEVFKMILCGKEHSLTVKIISLV
jgi:predicted transposase